MIKKGVIAIFILVITILIYSFIWGILFPWSPIKFGFNKVSYSDSSIFYPNNMSIPIDYELIDHLMSETEKFHNLRFKKKVNIIICATKSQYQRFSTQRSPICTMYTGSVIYVNPSIRDTKRDIKSFLKHELSHAIIYQNTTILKASKMKRWISEGLAVFYGNSHHYHQGKEFFILAVDEGYFFEFIKNSGNIGHIPKDIRYSFEYAEYRYFIEYLVVNFGSDLFFKFIHQYVLEPELEEELFKQIYNLELLDVFQRFESEVMNKKWLT
jgi:hypothetical protein